MTRLAGAIEAIRDAVYAVAPGMAAPFVCIDDDLVDDLHLNPYELESLSLIIEDHFSIQVPGYLFETALHRSVSALAEWALGQAQYRSWDELNRQRRSA